MSLKSIALFKNMEPMLATHGAALVEKVGCSYHFELRAKKGDKPTYITLNLKTGNGAIAEGKVGKADCTFVVLDDDFMALSQGKLKPQEAFMNGKMKIKGNMAKAMKFNPSILPKDAKL